MSRMSSSAAAAATPNVRPTPLKAITPNLLTLARAALTAALIAALSFYSHPHAGHWALPVGAGLFVAAALTDWLDGYLARRWNAVSLFGRVLDPAVDKVLVIGALVVLAGPGFESEMAGGGQVSGVAPWMAVAVLAREVIVTSARAAAEAGGVQFGAKWPGKAKMALQSVCVPAVLALLWLAPHDSLHGGGWARWTIDVTVWLTVGVTLLSGVPYVMHLSPSPEEVKRG